MGDSEPFALLRVTDHINVILSRAKNLGCYADLCSEALAA